MSRRFARGSCILVLNCGSSSIKFALFDGTQTPLPRLAMWSGKVEGILGERPLFSASDGQAETLSLASESSSRPYGAALEIINQRTADFLGGRGLAAVAHRVVHGGSKYFAPVLMDAQVLADLRSYIPLAPLHQPFALDAIESLIATQPGLPQVACFDTGFHHGMAQIEQMLPLPYEAWEDGMRRYGFHGLSYEYLSIVLAERYGDQARGRVIAAHLGSGASLCALRDLKTVTTTMGFSALDGLMMGTRCGALDPGALIYLMQIKKLSLEQVGAMLYHQSGLLGVSGVSSDPRELLAREDADPRCRLALDMYVARIVREIGALTAVLGGLDMLVFTAGIGEHNAAIRQRVCQALGFLGLDIDGAANAAHAASISTPASRVRAVIEPTNEEWIAALHAAAVLDASLDLERRMV